MEPSRSFDEDDEEEENEELDAFPMEGCPVPMARFSSTDSNMSRRGSVTQVGASSRFFGRALT